MQRLNTKTRLTTLCLSGFELYSRWVPLKSRLATNFRRNIGVLFTLDIVTGLREAHPNSIFSLAISVLVYYTANIVMSCFSAKWCSGGAFCLRHRARDPISVAFSDGVALFSDFNHLFELLDQVLLLIVVAPFIYWNYAQKTF